MEFASCQLLMRSVKEQARYSWNMFVFLLPIFQYRYMIAFLCYVLNMFNRGFYFYTLRLPDGFTQLKCLTSLCLNDVSLVRLPPDIGRYSNVCSTIDWRCCQILFNLFHWRIIIIFLGGLRCNCTTVYSSFSLLYYRISNFFH